MIYTIHKTEKQNSIKAIAERINYLGLLPPLWLLWHKAWSWLVFYILWLAIVYALQNTQYEFFAIVLLLFPSLYLFFEGGQFYRYLLKRRGYILYDIVEAPDYESAILKILYRQ